jgi:hypothetical protein
MQLVSKYLIILFFVALGQKGYTQFTVDSLAIDSMNQTKKVDPIEAKFLFSYYEQDGTKSPVTGGIGDEELTDRVGNISLNIPIKTNLKFTFLGGIDMYSSASTDNINNEHGLYTETSASHEDKRVYSNIGVLKSNDKKRIKYGGGIGASFEYDVRSYNLNASFSKLTKNRNTLFYFKGSVYNDKWKLIYPSELRWKYNTATSSNEEDDDDDNESSATRNTYNGLISISQDLTSRMKGSLTFEPTFQNGLLSTPFHRVYFFDSYNHEIEKLPDHRLKFPIGVRLNYFVKPYLIARLFYRYYIDDFGIQAHTASIELPIKPIRALAITPFYRFHTQTASKYFSPFGFHSIEDSFYTSDYDLANIQSNRVGLELRYSPIIKVKDSNKKRIVFKKVTLRSSKYFRNREDELILKAYIIALELNFSIE